MQVTVLGTRDNCPQRTYLQLKNQGIQKRQKERKATGAEENTACKATGQGFLEGVRLELGLNA